MFNKSGVALFVVLGTLLIVAVLAYVLMSIISSQTRFTYHQTSRVQAYYAAQAGMNYALEKLRTNNWTAANCTAPNGCLLSNLDPDFNSTFPESINDVRIILIPAGSGTPGCDTNSIPAGVTACINATANYTYTPP